MVVNYDGFHGGYCLMDGMEVCTMKTMRNSYIIHTRNTGYNLIIFVKTNVVGIRRIGLTKKRFKTLID